MTRNLEYPSRIGAPGSINAYTLDGGFTPAFTHFGVTHPATTYSSATDRLHYYVAAIETKAPAGTGGQPRQYGLVARSVFRYDSGTITDDLVNFQGAHDAFNDVVQGAVICDGPADGAPTSTTLGTSILLVTFGSGNPNPDSTAQTGVYYRVLSTDSSTPWNAATSTANATHMSAWQIIKAGADLYAVNDAGIAGSLGDYRVSKCPAGLNPTLITSWGNGIEVGTPEWIITGLAAIGNAPCVGKPDGLYFYDLQTRRYENVLKHFELTPHALNGKVTQSVTGGVVYTTFDGGVYFFDGVSVAEISPYKLWKMLGKDVPSARITAIADRGDGIVMFPEVGYQTTQNAGLVVNKVTSAGAATAITTNVVDGSLATGGDVSSLAATSFIDVWADIPFEAVVFHVTRAPNTTVAAVFGDVSYSSATDTFVATGGIIDGTRITGNATTATSGGSLSYVAFPPSASAGMVRAFDVDFGTLQQKVDFNYATGTDVTQKYGMRIHMSGAAFDASTEIDELEIVPFRAGLPNGGILSQATNYTPHFRAGLLQSVYFLKRKGTNTFTPHDLYALDSYGATWAVAWHAGRAGKASGQQNTGQGLIAWGRYTTMFISEGPTRNPSKDLYPITANGTDGYPPHPAWQFLKDWDGGDALREKKIERIRINTRFLEPTDSWEIHAQHDERDIVIVAAGKGGPIWLHELPFANARVINAWLVLSRGQMTNERAPQFLEPIRIDFEWNDEETDAQDPSRAEGSRLKT